MKSKILFCITLFISSVAFTQSSGEIIGKLTDSLTSEPIIGAGVSLEQNGVIIMQAPSEDIGAFYFKPIKPGKYQLKISALGYRPIIMEDLYVSSKDITFLNLKMSSMSEELPPFIVKWEEEVVSDVPLISQDEIKQSGSRDAIELVAKTVPGVYAEDGGENGAIYITGSRADATLYIIDGVRVDGSAYLTKSSILEIVVYTGGIPAKYGDVTGGVIEITTRSFSGIY